MDHGHVHEDEHDQKQPVVTTSQHLGYPFQLQTKGWCGKAPPVDSFSGEDPEITIEEWLPSLQRVMEWNKWSEQEILIQLVGHLRREIGNVLFKFFKIDWSMGIQPLPPKSSDT